MGGVWVPWFLNVLFPCPGPAASSSRGRSQLLTELWSLVGDADRASHWRGAEWGWMEGLPRASSCLPPAS